MNVKVIQIPLFNWTVSLHIGDTSDFRSSLESFGLGESSIEAVVKSMEESDSRHIVLPTARMALISVPNYSLKAHLLADLGVQLTAVMTSIKSEVKYDNVTFQYVSASVWSQLSDFIMECLVVDPFHELGVETEEVIEEGN